MRKLATIRRIDELRPIAGADRIEVAVVGGWQCVVKKGEFAVGNLAVYCEIDSFLPVRPEFEFLRKSSYRKMDDIEGFRLRTVKLRGQISQGLLLPTSVLETVGEVGTEVTEELGITKYEPPTPACLTGKVVGPFPSAIEKTEEERIQNLADEYPSYFGKSFFVSEKLDGTSFTAFLDDEFGVCGRNWQYARDDSNSYWQIADRLDLQTKLKGCNRRLAIQGELIGPGIQKNRYRLKQQELYVFNVFDIDRYAYLDKAEANDLCQELDLNSVPFIGQMEVPSTIEEILKLAEGESVLNPDAEREGLVWVYGSGNGRISFKTISNKFLSEE